MNQDEALDSIIASVASHGGGTEHGLKRLRDQGLPEQIDALRYLLSTVSDEEVKELEKQPHVNRFLRSNEAAADAARFVAVIEMCGQEIYQRRLRAMAASSGSTVPQPYGHPPFDSLNRDEEALVGLNQLRDLRTLLVHEGWMAHLASTTGATNDTHWLLPAIIRLGMRDQSRVRLDPFVFGPEGEFPIIMQKMTVYGKPLDWESLAALREPLLGQFENFDGLGPKVRTDYVWQPRDHELHFEAEEVPHTAQGELSSGRYFHAIYDTRLRKVTHFDGAIRIYSGEELSNRRAVHLSRAGKAGHRAKIFRVDGKIDPNTFAEVAKPFFVWNYDMQHYFDGTERDGYF